MVPALRAAGIPAIAARFPLDGPQPTFDPPLEAVLAAPIGTLRHVPSACRVRVATVLGGILSRLVRDASWEDAYRLLAFPKMVLGPLPRRVGRHPAESANEFHRRIDRFRRGEFGSLWHRDTQTRRQAPITRARTEQEALGEPSDSVLRSVCALVEEGAWAKAAKTLTSRGLADMDIPDNRTRLVSLNPLGQPVSCPPPVPADSKLTGDAWSALVHAAVTSFPAGGAPGTSGLRPCHLKDLRKRAGSLRRSWPP